MLTWECLVKRVMRTTTLLWTVLNLWMLGVFPNVNKAGRLLVDLAATTSMAITAGLAPGDYGQLSYVGYYRTSTTV
eukprot:scaffold137087_cov20-Tisochrysis_lutea.AAC.1